MFSAWLRELEGFLDVLVDAIGCLKCSNHFCAQEACAVLVPQFCQFTRGREIGDNEVEIMLLF